MNDVVAGSLCYIPICFVLGYKHFTCIIARLEKNAGLSENLLSLSQICFPIAPEKHNFFLAISVHSASSYLPSLLFPNATEGVRCQQVNGKRGSGEKEIDLYISEVYAIEIQNKPRLMSFRTKNKTDLPEYNITLASF